MRGVSWRVGARRRLCVSARPPGLSVSPPSAGATGGGHAQPRPQTSRGREQHRPRAESACARKDAGHAAERSRRRRTRPAGCAPRAVAPVVHPGSAAVDVLLERAVDLHDHRAGRQEHAVVQRRAEERDQHGGPPNCPHLLCVAHQLKVGGHKRQLRSVPGARGAHGEDERGLGLNPPIVRAVRRDGVRHRPRRRPSRRRPLARAMRACAGRARARRRADGGICKPPEAVAHPRAEEAHPARGEVEQHRQPRPPRACAQRRGHAAVTHARAGRASLAHRHPRHAAHSEAGQPGRVENLDLGERAAASWAQVPARRDVHVDRRARAERRQRRRGLPARPLGRAGGRGLQVARERKVKGEDELLKRVAVDGGPVGEREGDRHGGDVRAAQRLVQRRPREARRLGAVGG